MLPCFHASFLVSGVLAHVRKNPHHQIATRHLTFDHHLHHRIALDHHCSHQALRHQGHSRYAGSCAVIFKIAFHVMRPLIPPLRSGPRGFSASLRILIPLPAHYVAIPVRLGALRSFSAGPLPSVRTLKPFPGFSALNHTSRYTWIQRRQPLSTSPILSSTRQKGKGESQAQAQKILPPEVEAEGFGRSEKASRAAQVNLSARLNKDGSPSSTKPGMGEIVRLLKIARPEAKWLGGRNSDGRNFVRMACAKYES